MLERAHTFTLQRKEPQKEYLVGLWRVGCVPALSLVAALYLFDAIDFPIMAYFLIVMALGILLPPILLLLLKPGDVTIDPSGLLLHGPADSYTVPWSDIASVELEDLNSRIPRWLCSIVRVDGSRKYVNVKLRVPLRRTRLPSFRMTTTGNGTQLAVGKSLVFVPDDLDTFVHEANELRARGSA